MYNLSFAQFDYSALCLHVDGIDWVVAICERIDVAGALIVIAKLFAIFLVPHYSIFMLYLLLKLLCPILISLVSNHLIYTYVAWTRRCLDRSIQRWLVKGARAREGLLQRVDLGKNLYLKLYSIWRMLKYLDTLI